jgi:hypothetical protein
MRRGSGRSSLIQVVVVAPRNKQMMIGFIAAAETAGAIGTIA